MTRDNLKLFQDTYAERMAKFGLIRGKKGSKARHISTQQYYRKIYTESEELQENIKVLQEQEQEAKIKTQQAELVKTQKVEELKETEESLHHVKGQLKTEKFKNTAADVGSTIIEGIGSMIGTSKVKLQQKEIESLRMSCNDLKEHAEKLNQTITRERSEHEKESKELKNEINTIHDWLPDISTLLKWGEYCLKMGFTKHQAKDIINRKPVLFSGELYSTHYSKRFKADNAEIRLEKNTGNSGVFRLLINRMDVFDWFKEKNREFQEAIGFRFKQKPIRKKGEKL